MGRVLSRFVAECRKSKCERFEMRINTASVLVIGALLLGGCSSSNNDDGGVQQVTLPTTPVAVSKITVQLQDVSGNPLPGVSVTIDDNETGLLAKMVGRSAGIVSRSAAKKFAAKATTVQSDQFGDIFFDLEEGVTEGDLSITIDEAGYFPLTQIYKIESEETVEVLVLTPKPASGETVAIEEVDEEGETKEVVSLAADKTFTEENVSVVNEDGVAVNVQGTVARVETKNVDAETGAKTVVAEVIIPSSVAPKTEEGVEAVGEIKISAAIYQNASDVAVEAFPGGLALGSNLENPLEAPALSESDESDETDTTGFITGGFVSLEVTDEDGNDITQFDGSTGVDIDGDGVEEKGLLVTSLVSKQTINPDTNELVKIGDSIPVWSYDEETGKWEFDGNSVIFEEANADNFRARFAATHLSSWNLDFYVPYCTGLKLVVFRTPSGDVDRRQLRVKTRLNAGYSRTSFVYGDGYLLSWTSPRQNLKMSVFDRGTGESIAIQSINGQAYNASAGYNFCSQGLLVKNVMLEQAPVLVDVNVKVETSCSDESLDSLQPPKAIPSATVNLLNALGQRVSTKVADSNGEVTISGLRETSNYNLFVEDRVTFGPPKLSHLHLILRTIQYWSISLKSAQ